MRMPTFGSFLVALLLVFAFLSLFARVSRGQDLPVDCWENCLSNSAAGAYQNEYSELYNMIQTARTMRLLSGTNSSLLVIDVRDPATSALMKLLAQITVMSSPALTGFNPAYFVLFDDSSAWYDQSWQNLGRCQAVNVLQTMTDFPPAGANNTIWPQTFGNDVIRQDFSRGKIESSCLLGAHAMNLLQNGFLSNAVYDPTHVSAPVINGFVGGEFENFDSFNPPGSRGSHLSSDTKNAMGSALDDLTAIRDINPELPNPSAPFQAYCSRFFQERFLVGSNRANPDDMEEWGSSTAGLVPGSQYMSQSSNLLAAAQQLASCMKTSCCPSGGSGREMDSKGSLCITLDAKENFQLCGGEPFSVQE